MNQNKKTENETPEKKGGETPDGGKAYCLEPGCPFKGSIPEASEHARETGHEVDWN